MPTCVRCEAYFPWHSIIDGKTRYANSRKLCYECSPFGKHNTRLEPSPNGTTQVCESCNRVYEWKRGGSSKGLCRGCTQTKKRRDRKKLVVEMAGGKCVLCGYNRCVAALQFHHLDQTQKDVEFGSQLHSMKRILAELKKCILLCSNCHAEVHVGVSSVDGRVAQMVRAPA